MIFKPGPFTLAVYAFEKYTVFLWELFGPQKSKTCGLYKFCLHRIFYRIPGQALFVKTSDSGPFTLPLNRPSPEREVFCFVHGSFESGPSCSGPSYRRVVQSLDSIEWQRSDCISRLWMFYDHWNASLAFINWVNAIQIEIPLNLNLIWPLDVTPYPGYTLPPLLKIVIWLFGLILCPYIGWYRVI